MAKYILVYEIGFAHKHEVMFEEFGLDEEQKMHDRVNEIANVEPTFNVLCAAFVGSEFKYEPVKTAVSLRPVYK